MDRMDIRQGFIISIIAVIGAISVQPAFAQNSSEQDSKKSSDSQTQTSGMSQAEIASIIGDIAGSYEGSPSNIQFEIDGAPLMLLSDVRANRMRLLAPIIAADDMNQEHIVATMISNFHLALDARYAVGNGVLYSAYIHPLKELTREQLESAVRQVTMLRATFGTSYTSGEMSFGAQREADQEI